MTLPPELRAALDVLLRDVSPRDLSQAVTAVSSRYRSSPSATSFIRSDTDALAYLAYRLPATFAAVADVFRHITHAVPLWKPDSMLDVGAGPGGAAWAALSEWPGLRSLALLERDDRMIALGKSLVRHAESDTLRDAFWSRTDLVHGIGETHADLVVAAYLLGEIQPDERPSIVDALWRSTDGVLAVVEPGTPAGFATIRAARATLIECGACVVAPCPHDDDCPIAHGDWCHFSARLPRSKVHRESKGGDLPYEDEKYSYVAVSRQAPTYRGDRILRHPQIHPGRIRFQLCTPDGLQDDLVTRRDKAQFRAARDASWGDVLPRASDPESGTP